MLLEKVLRKYVNLTDYWYKCTDISSFKELMCSGLSVSVSWCVGFTERIKTFYSPSSYLIFIMQMWKCTMLESKIISGANLSRQWARGGVQPGHVARISHGQITIYTYIHSYCLSDFYIAIGWQLNTACYSTQEWSHCKNQWQGHGSSTGSL